MRLTKLLDRTLARLWHAKKAQEALLDLGERKRWRQADRQAQLRAVARWLIDTGVAPSVVTPVPSAAVTLTDARRRVARVGPEPITQDAAVAADLHRIAPLVGASTPKALANSLSGWPRQRRPDHRWLLAVTALKDSQTPRGLVFDDRSQAHMATLLARTAGRVEAERLDARDALVIFSLLALWQRRRPTREVRANRGQPSTRRRAPKPIADLARDLIGPRQFEVLVDAAIAHRQPAIAELAFEAALTAAHMGPHRTRKTTDPDLRWLLPRVCLRVPQLIDLLGPDRAAMWQHRVAIMESYRDRVDRPPPPDTIADHPYVRMTTLLDRQRRGEAIDRDALRQALADDWPGKAMLAPIILHRLESR